MNITEQIKGFFAVGPMLHYLEVHNYHVVLSDLLTLDGMRIILPVIFPALFLIEFLFLFFFNKLNLKRQYSLYKIPLISYALNIYLAAFITIDVGIYLFEALSKYAPFHVGLSFAGFFYALLVWELGNYVFHYSCHKVRLLWCLHSPHHAPVDMNLSVIWTAFFLHGTYATVVRMSIAALLGVQLDVLILVIMTIGVWGAYIHVSEEVLPSRTKDNWISYWFIGPSDHRVHHARNALYIDKNYCNLFTIWDKLFGTYQPINKDEKPEYGIMREMNDQSFLDNYLGEFYLLGKDLAKTRSVKEALFTIFGPPGGVYDSAK